jgi:SAM-dependent methyltransferase
MIAGMMRPRAPRTLPLPPIELRELVGLPDAADWDQPDGRPVFPNVRDPDAYDLILDFGCGCGRIARKLALAAAPAPERYIGTDLHAGMIKWCQENLQAVLPQYEFVHQNVQNAGLNPGDDLPTTLPLPVADDSVSLLVAHSVFTHLTESQAGFYLREARRVLRPGGTMVATFFLFEKRYFPMMQRSQNALYINPVDPSNAVIFDREWLLTALSWRGLRVRAAEPPAIRGFQWRLEIDREPRPSIALSEDHAPFGHQPPPVPDRPAYLVGK